MEPNRSKQGQSITETAKTKRPYNKIPQEIRAQILHALVVEKLPLQQVAEKFQTKPCTCKAILLTYEQEGRCEKKTTRRDRIEIESHLKVLILDPLGRDQSKNIYTNIKHSKIYSEEKELSKEHEAQLQKKLTQEVNSQIGELQSSCYNIDKGGVNWDTKDEIAPENVIRGINMSLHVVGQQIREQPLYIERKKSEKLQKLENKSTKIVEQNSDTEQIQDVVYNYNKIKGFMNQVISKSTNSGSLMEQLTYLTNQAILQSLVLQKICNEENDIRNLQTNIKVILRSFLNMNQNFF